jgi:hypothetical protein
MKVILKQKKTKIVFDSTMKLEALLINHTRFNNLNVINRSVISVCFYLSNPFNSQHPGVNSTWKKDSTKNIWIQDIQITEKI